MSKRRNNNRSTNPIKKFFRNRWVQMTCVALAAILVCGMLGNLTEGFTNFKGESMKDRLSTMHINKDNLFFDKIEDGVISDTVNAKATADSGVIKLTANIADTNTDAVTVAETITFATVQLKEGTYSFTAYDNKDWKSCYVVGTYTLDGTTHTWYADYESITSFDNTETAHARTLELAEDVEVTFSIKLCEGVELENAKITPVLVEGEDVGNYYAGLLGLIG